MILAMRAIWADWYDGQRLDFRGEFYSHTLMTPMFRPDNTEHGAPRVFLAAVGPLMTSVAGEVADGLIAHAFTTERYLREVTLPSIETGLAKSGRAREQFEITCPTFVVSGPDAPSADQSKVMVQRQIAFYGSTPAYRGVLELHGWGDLQPELNRLSKEGKWEEMGTLISDDILDAFAIVAPPDEVAARLIERFGGLLDRAVCTFASATPPQQKQLIERIHAAGQP